MFSLAKFVDEQLNFFGDVLDKRPSQVSRSLRDPLLLVLDDNLPLKSKVTSLLHSELASQKVWAITNIARLVSMNINCDDLIKEIPKCFLSKSAKVELAAAKLCHALLYYDAAKYTEFFIKPVMDRITAVPAMEYAQCIELMAPQIDSIDSISSFVPLIKKLFEQDDSHQHAGSLIVKNIPTIDVTEEEFQTIFLTSKVFVNEYLSPQIALNFSEAKFGENWLEVTLPNQLLQLDERFHQGVAKFFVDFMGRIKTPNLYSSVHDAFDWAVKDPRIALSIIQKVDIVSKSRFVDLVNKVYQLLLTIANFNESFIRKDLPKILVDNPMLFNAPENVLKQVFTSLGNDSDPIVKCAFLEQLEIIYNSTKLSRTKEHILMLYQNMLKDNDIKVLEKLVTETSSMFVVLADQRPSQIMNLFLHIAELFKTRWRFFSKILRSFEMFPTNTLVYGIKPLLSLICEAVKVNPQVLMPQVISFYTFCIHSRFDCLKLPDLLRYLAHEYGKSEKYQMRIVYIKLANSLLNEFNDDRSYYIENIWSHIAEYKNESVEFVYIKLLEYILAFIPKYDVKDSNRLTQDVLSILSNKKFCDSQNPDIVYLISRIKPLVPNQPRSMSAQPSFEHLPAIVDKTSPRLRRPINTPQSPHRGNASGAFQSGSPNAPIKMPPRPNQPSCRKPSPKVSTRPRPQSFMPNTRSMVKSSSNSGINSMRFPKL
ncbi:hypothetical protein TRFO_29551 [Tritrichomonas foetus]|uniref:Uncharacterized protein n=1 Tax=Tritrichomonas foetus TaxID=1144522 RepID=A0A1J4JZY8_9EUKA|nr:hypothetical protein TRFO_29551 [Tritrichomonas foetus]|eukprot:OHT03092.1 hypothetical protein TRFO_29551 [Tritrichomonas foetus]